MEESRMYVAAAFAVLSHWAKSPLTAWPDYLKAVIRDAERLLGEEIIWPPIEQYLKNERQSVDVTAVVRYLLNLKTGIRRDELGLRNLEDMDNVGFRKTYFNNNKIDAAMNMLNNYLQNHEVPPHIDVLYKFIPGFGWEFIKE